MRSSAERDTKHRGYRVRGPRTHLDRRRTVVSRLKRKIAARYAALEAPVRFPFRDEDMVFKRMAPELREESNAAVLCLMDTSGSMSGSRMAAQRTAVSRLIAEIGANALEPNDIQIVTWNSTVSGTILRRNVDAAAYGELKDWVDALPTTVSGGT